LELSLSLFFLLFHTLGHLDNSCSTLALEERRKRKDKKARGKKRSSKEEQDQVVTMGLLASIELHV